MSWYADRRSAVVHSDSYFALYSCRCGQRTGWKTKSFFRWPWQQPTSHEQMESNNCSYIFLDTAAATAADLEACQNKMKDEKSKESKSRTMTDGVNVCTRRTLISLQWTVDFSWICKYVEYLQNQFVKCVITNRFSSSSRIIRMAKPGNEQRNTLAMQLKIYIVSWQNDAWNT